MNAYEVKRAKQWLADRQATKQAKENIISLLRLTGYVLTAVAVYLVIMA